MYRATRQPTWRSVLAARSALLYVTDLTYRANGREYGSEDILLSSRLRDHFSIALCHPLDASSLMPGFDLIVVRNSGPVLNYRAEYDAFRDRARTSGARVYNTLTGRADMAGKQYLVDLTVAGFPVIPTVDHRDDLDWLPNAAQYVVKPKLGADSIGLEYVSAGALHTRSFDGVLIQPRIDFLYEVSFYFIDHTLQYALFAPEPHKRWDLMPYHPSTGDLAFAQRFIDWNTIDHGIQRVDACRCADGDLLLVELEDLNPFLSLDLLDATTLDAFVVNLKASLQALMESPPGHVDYL
jgi:hypothetical protein